MIKWREGKEEEEEDKQQQTQNSDIRSSSSGYSKRGQRMIVLANDECGRESYDNNLSDDRIFYNYDYICCAIYLPRKSLSLSLSHGINSSMTYECQTRKFPCFQNCLRPHPRSLPQTARSLYVRIYSFRSFHWILFKFDLYNIFRLENFVVLIICLLDAFCSFRQNEWMSGE